MGLRYILLSSLVIIVFLTACNDQSTSSSGEGRASYGGAEGSSGDAKKGIRLSDFENPPVFEAAKLLPKEMISSSLYSISPQVKNDGYLNHFEVKSRFGNYGPHGRQLLELRIREIHALDLLEREFPSSKVAGDAAAEAAEGIVTAPVRGVEKLADTVSDPEKLGDTVASVPSGVVGLFGAAANAVKDGAVFVAETGAAVVSGDGEKTSAQMDKAGKTITKAAGKYSGYDQAYREIARALQVSPFTDNQKLRDEMRRVANVQTGVGLGSKLAPAMVGVPYVGTANKLVGRAEQVAAYEDPEKIERLNGEVAKTLGLNKGDKDPIYSAFVASPAYNPATRRIILKNLERMKGVKELSMFLKMAAKARTLEGGLFYTSASDNLADYHEQTKRFVALVSEVIVPAGITASGDLVVPLPVDHIVWTKEVATILKGFEERVQSYEVKRSVIRIAGTASPRAKEELKRFGAEEIKESVGYF